MKTYQSFGALARALERSVAALPATLENAMKAGALSVTADAKERIGHYQQGWELLADSTVDQKRRLGYANVALLGGDGGDNPLLRTGDMRESITADITNHAFVVGSSEPVLLYQEIGTRTIPPRPVLEPALKTMMPFIGTVTGKAIVKTIEEGR
jgi:phage gpG-like protein